MTSRSQIKLLSAVLISVGVGLTLYKFFFLHFPLMPGSVRTVWSVEAKITFDAEGGAIEANLALPGDQHSFEILDETFASSGYDFSIESNNNQRRAIWKSETQDGEQNLYYNLQITNNEHAAIPADITAPSRPTTAAAWLPAEREAALGIIETAKARSGPDRPIIQELLAMIGAETPSEDVHLLLSSTDSPSKAALAIHLLAELGIYAHLIRGVKLENRAHNNPPIELVEIYESGNWITYDPRTGEKGLPESFFIWQRGGPSLLDLTGGSKSKIRFSSLSNVIPAKNVALKLAREETVALVDFNIYSLPVEKQTVFKSLLLVPIGALVVVMFRILVGVRTSGTFMPVLIALAFIQTTLLTGIGILLVLVASGLWVRSYFSKMDLHMVSRIGAVLIIVVVLMAGFSVLSHKLGWDEALNMTFFPMVILAWTIERMSITWEEEGPREVAIQGGGSLLVAVCAYFAMTNKLVEHLTFNFPELLLGVLGLILLLGQYTGFRLLELHRFRHMDT